jgi:small membrane protein
MIFSALLIGCLLSAAIYGFQISSKGNHIIGVVIIFLALGGVFFVVRPEYSTLVANYLGIGRGTDLLLYLLFIMSIILIFLVHIKFRQHDILIASLARSIALSRPSSKPMIDDGKEESI